jgi:hypothetical protein
MGCNAGAGRRVEVGLCLVPEGVVVGKFAHLIGGGGDQAFLVVAEIHRPQSGEAVEDPEHGR